MSEALMVLIKMLGKQMSYILYSFKVVVFFTVQSRLHVILITLNHERIYMRNIGCAIIMLFNFWQLSELNKYK